MQSHSRRVCIGGGGGGQGGFQDEICLSGEVGTPLAINITQSDPWGGGGASSAEFRQVTAGPVAEATGCQPQTHRRVPTDQSLLSYS